MDWNDIDRLREPGFTVARRGYERHEVDRLLASLVDWLETDAPKDLGELAIKRKLEFVGKSTSRILLTTEQEAAQLRRRTQDECGELRAEAEAAALGKRQAADEHAQKVRAKADEDARRTVEAAGARAKQIVEEGERRREKIDGVVRELEAQRDRTIKELERLRAALDSTIATQKPGARPAEGSAAKQGKRAKAPDDADALAKA